MEDVSVKISPQFPDRIFSAQRSLKTASLNRSSAMLQAPDRPRPRGTVIFTIEGYLILHILRPKSTACPTRNIRKQKNL